MLNALERLEEKIEGLESRQKELEKTLADPEIFKDKERSVPLLNEYTANQEELENLISEWEKRHISLESAKKRLGV
ncbi:MAG: hypothetical protein DRN37_05315 [Thermoplasmata archaeon]|nr:MAG: hypothetical protein DRN37_05315 [Thermoplasmata archaeon]